MSELVKCGNPDCGKRFPVNTWKHPDREIIYCPFCKTPHKNRFFSKEWKPNETWHKNRHISKPFTIADMRRSLEGAVKGIFQPKIAVKSVSEPVTVEEKGEKTEH